MKKVKEGKVGLRVKKGKGVSKGGNDLIKLATWTRIRLKA